MSDDERQEWTLATLRVYLLALIKAKDARYAERFESSQIALSAALAAQRLSVDAALTAQKEAVRKAETSSEKRFESVNEFRLTLSDQQRTLMPRTEVLTLIKTTEDKLDVTRITLDARIDQLRIIGEKQADDVAKELATLHEAIATLITPIEHTSLLTRVGNLETVSANMQGRLWAIGLGLTVGLTVLTIIINVVTHFIP